MKNIFIIIVVTFCTYAFSQDVKLKKGDVLVDDVVWMKYQDCGTFDQTCSLSNTSGDELIFMKFITVKGAEPITQSNPQGNLFYVEIKFLGLKKSFEIVKRQKAIIQLLYNSKILNQDGTLNEEKSSTLVEKYGTEFSDRLNRTNNQTIIIKEVPTRSGVNINIGR